MSSQSGDTPGNRLFVQAGFRDRPELLRGFIENIGFIERLMRLVFYDLMKKDIDLFHKEEKSFYG